MKILNPTRRFNWISSISGDKQVLAELDRQMQWFYGQEEGRQSYQAMLSTQESNIESVPEESVRVQMPRYVCSIAPETILEIGCGDGRLFRQLRSYGYSGSYTGIEIADYVIECNKNRHPNETWIAGSAYKIPCETNSVDVCFSLYVIEHFIYPEVGLTEMLRVLKPGGQLVLAFPDFVASGRFASQQLGLSQGRVKEKLLRGKLFDALLSAYDSRFRLPRALNRAVEKYGPFPVNTTPLCLSETCEMGADVDAVYIASKDEVHHWAKNKGCQVHYPCGMNGEFTEQAFLVIIKPLMVSEKS